PRSRATTRHARPARTVLARISAGCCLPSPQRMTPVGTRARCARVTASSGQAPKTDGQKPGPLPFTKHQKEENKQKLEARATFNRAAVPKTCAAAARLIVAMGPAATGRYMANDVPKGRASGLTG